MPLARTLKIVDGILRYLMRWVCITCFVLLFLLLAGNVFIRNFPIIEIYWFDEVVECAFAWMVFFGAARLWAMDSHFKLQWLSDRIPGPRHRCLFRMGIELICLAFLLVFTWQSFRLTLLARDWTPFFNVSRRYLYVCMPAAGLIMTGYSLAAIVRDIRAVSSPDLLPPKGTQ